MRAATAPTHVLLCKNSPEICLKDNLLYPQEGLLTRFPHLMALLLNEGFSSVVLDQTRSTYSFLRAWSEAL